MNDGEHENNPIQDKCTPCYLSADSACMLTPYSRQFCLGPFSDHSDRMAKIKAMREEEEPTDADLNRALWRRKREEFRENIQIFETLMQIHKEDK